MKYWKDLERICELHCDRQAFLEQWLKEKELPYQALQTGEFRHYLITPGGTPAYRQDYRTKILVAHYDRVENSPGANDNAAAVFQLLDFAMELQESNKKHNCLIILSDGEELNGQRSLKEQGAYLLAEKLGRHQLQDSLILVLDLCGIGDCLVYGTSEQRALQQDLIPRGLQELLDRHGRKNSIRQLSYFSDDLGFMAQTFSTLLVSMLPKTEVPCLAEEIMPPSWAKQHSMADSFQGLERQSFRIMGSFLRQIGHLLLEKVHR